MKLEWTQTQHEKRDPKYGDLIDYAKYGAVGCMHTYEIIVHRDAVGVYQWVTGTTKYETDRYHWFHNRFTSSDRLPQFIAEAQAFAQRWEDHQLRKEFQSLRNHMDKAHGFGLSAQAWLYLASQQIDESDPGWHRTSAALKRAMDAMSEAQTMMTKAISEARTARDLDVQRAQLHPSVNPTTAYVRGIGQVKL